MGRRRLHARRSPACCCSPGRSATATDAGACCSPGCSCSAPPRRRRRTRAASEALIAARAVMGAGAALIMPATLSLLISVFEDERERATAVGIWAATAGLGVALGPVVGGFLLEHFWWGSIFIVNVPLCVLAIVGRPARGPRVARPGRAADRLGRRRAVGRGPDRAGVGGHRGAVGGLDVAGGRRRGRRRAGPARRVRARQRRARRAAARRAACSATRASARRAPRSWCCSSRSSGSCSWPPSTCSSCSASRRSRRACASCPTRAR